MSYETPQGYRYKINSEGEITKVEGQLQLGEGKRNEYAQRTVEWGDRLPNGAEF